MPRRADRRRAALALTGLALALGAALWQPGGGQRAEAAHTSNPKGHYWTDGAVTTTRLWFHVNIWTQPCTGRGCPQPPVVTDRSHCTLRGTDPDNVDSDGCGHSRDDWSWGGHGGCVTVDGNRHCHNDDMGQIEHFCVGGSASTVTAAAHCGTWTACENGTLTGSDPPTGCTPCAEGLVPNADWSACGPPDCESGKHRHGDGACEDNHPPEVGPDCETGLTAEVTVTWTYHNAAGDNTGGSKICGPDDDDDGDDGPVAVVCVSGQHSHAPAVPGGPHRLPADPCGAVLHLVLGRVMVAGPRRSFC